MLPRGNPKKQPIVENATRIVFDKPPSEKYPHIVTFDDLFCSGITDANCNFPILSEVPPPRIFVGALGSSSEEPFEKIPEEKFHKLSKELVTIPEGKEIIVDKPNKPITVFCKYCDYPLKDTDGNMFDHTRRKKQLGCNKLQMKVTTTESDSVINIASYNKVHMMWAMRNNMYC
uniref:Uncharacterized protein n=1 Tax=viral metagenome TaxID=1070528 RepID=A0A6C0C658_9ZZZZ